MKQLKSEPLALLKKALPGYLVFAFGNFDAGEYEFNLRSKKKSYPLACTYISTELLRKLERIFRTRKIYVTAYDISQASDGSDHVLYVLVGRAP